MEKGPQFLMDVDYNGNQYFAFNATTIKKVFRPQNATQVGVNITSFLSETLVVTRKATGIFSTDLTSRDDLILAILSLTLLFIVEGILTAILLRTYNGRVSNFSFSIKQFIELVRDFKVTHLIRGQRRGRTDAGTGTRVNKKLLVIATIILSFSLGLEVVILSLSTPNLVAVTNRLVSFELVAVVIPDWNEVRRNIRSSVNRPCTALLLSDVEQEDNQVSGCMASTGLLARSGTFRKANKSVDVMIRSDLHEFGGEHEVMIDGESAKYVSRAYFTLGDAKNRLMRKRESYYNLNKAVGLVHKQLIAFLFNYYNEVIDGDSEMNLDRLEDLKFKLKAENGPVVNIMQVRGQERFRQAVSTRYTTNVSGVIPSGPEALRFAQVVLKGSTGISVAGPDVMDLDMGSGNTVEREALMWYESSRTINWLSLCIVVGCSFLVLAGLRWVLRPVATANIAGALVWEALAADASRAADGRAEADEQRGVFNVRRFAEMHAEPNKRAMAQPNVSHVESIYLSEETLLEDSLT